MIRIKLIPIVGILQLRPFRSLFENDYGQKEKFGSLVPGTLFEQLLVFRSGKKNRKTNH